MLIATVKNGIVQCGIMVHVHVVLLLLYSLLDL